MNLNHARRQFRHIGVLKNRYHKRYSAHLRTRLK